MMILESVPFILSENFEDLFSQLTYENLIDNMQLKP